MIQKIKNLFNKLKNNAVNKFGKVNDKVAQFISMGLKIVVVTTVTVVINVVAINTVNPLLILLAIIQTISAVKFIYDRMTSIKLLSNLHFDIRSLFIY